MDIDLDCDEALVVGAFPGLFGSFPAFGRDTLPHPGHRLMICPDLPDGASRKLEPSGEKAIVEIRAGPNYTIFPPSRHDATPEKPAAQLEWQDGVPETFPEIAWNDLLLRARLVGLMALALRHYPKEGGRDDFFMALGGTTMNAPGPPMTQSS